MRHIFLVSLMLLPMQAGSPPSLFEEAVTLIKKHEGWHGERHHPYVGYGHRLLKGENFDHRITEPFADSLLRRDLRLKCSRFRQFGADSLLLGALAYNVGEAKLLGDGKHPRSKLIRRLEAGNRDVYRQYTSFCRYKGKIIPSLKRRREEEFQKLFINNNNPRQ